MNYVEKLGDIAAIEPLTTDLKGWVVVEGMPSMKTWVQHKSNDDGMVSGYWEATPGTYHATYTEYEFVHIIEGKLTITPDGGASVFLGSGDAFVVEPGFKGLWKIEETIRKHFCSKV
ncbi:cupin domain-containing protein [Mesorhizobium sp. M0999]|uniref:cupin domain-containing protein n=1 Tax=Mesorhizobium sp. M0999 TaxID=2957045 RepID=UPI00333BF0D9